MKRKTARAILITQKNEICLIKRIKNDNEYWVTPGGGVEDGETPLEALVRELIEEIGSVVEHQEEPAFIEENEVQIDYFYVCREISRGKPTGIEHTVSNSTNSYQIMNINFDEAREINLVPNHLKNKIIDLAEFSIK